jgi:hypothetical protein
MATSDGDSTPIAPTGTIRRPRPSCRRLRE